MYYGRNSRTVGLIRFAGETVRRLTYRRKRDYRQYAISYESRRELDDFIDVRAFSRVITDEEVRFCRQQMAVSIGAAVCQQSSQMATNSLRITPLQASTGRSQLLVHRDSTRN